MYQCADCLECFEEAEEAKAHYHEYGHKTSNIDWDEYEAELAEDNRAYRSRQKGSINEGMEEFWNKSNR